MPNQRRLNAARAPRPRTSARARRGLAAGWLLIWSPIFLLAILLTVEVGNVLLAKVQLENALEASALAAVSQWQASGEPQARSCAVGFANANTVNGSPVVVVGNGGSGADMANPNNNEHPNGHVVLGAATPGAGANFSFNPDAAPNTTTDDGPYFGVKTQLTVEVTPICKDLFGLPLGGFSVSGAVHAAYFGGKPRLIRVP